MKTRIELDGPYYKPGRIRNALAWALGMALLVLPFVMAWRN